MQDCNVKHLGSLTELEVMTYLFKLGYQVSIPYGDNAPYDLILDVNNKLLKIQVKTSRKIEDGVYEFTCIRTRINKHQNIRKAYSDKEVDFFATMINGICYLVPFNETSNSKRLRFLPPKNNQVKGITFAKEYEAEIQLNKLVNN